MVEETRVIGQVAVRRGRSLMAKRALDVGLCLLILPVALIVVALIALAILIAMGRPIFFMQDRVGRDGKIFRLIKFRTLIHGFDDPSAREYMRAFVRGMVGDEKPGREWVHKPLQKRDIPRVGYILRKTSLDELPQIFNVLRGDMSLIGPRPNVTWEVDAYLEWHRERLKVLPGITGLAQVRGRSHISFDQIVESDIEYIERQSLGLDLKILWWTLTSVLGGRGAG
jgi:lipopolysaccharide/colanic/teichoic acid biosynthesis glycosyltransferase